VVSPAGSIYLCWRRSRLPTLFAIDEILALDASMEGPLFSNLSVPLKSNPAHPYK
jgi:hypothetical protein